MYSETERDIDLVALGGGTGLSTLLAGLKRLVGDGGRGAARLSSLAAIVTVSTAEVAGDCATSCKSCRPATYATAW